MYHHASSPPPSSLLSLLYNHIFFSEWCLSSLKYNYPFFNNLQRASNLICSRTARKNTAPWILDKPILFAVPVFIVSLPFLPPFIIVQIRLCRSEIIRAEKEIHMRVPNSRRGCTRLELEWRQEIENCPPRRRGWGWGKEFWVMISFLSCSLYLLSLLSRERASLLLPKQQ